MKTRPGGFSKSRAGNGLPTRLFLCVVLALQTTPYGVISPLLPGIVDNLAVAPSQAGLITGAYTAGLLPACLVLMFVRRPLSDAVVVLTGLLFLALGCAIFADAGAFAQVIVGRILMGFGSGLCFTGASRWLVKSAPGRESLFFGLSWGMLSVGQAVGPVVGAVAVDHGTQMVHRLFALIFGVGAIIASSMALFSTERAPTQQKKGRGVPAAHLWGERSFVYALVPLIIPSLAIGVLYTVIPLRLATEGQAEWVAPTFLAAAVLGAGAGPVAGVVTRRFGENPTVVFSLSTTAVLFAVLVGPFGALSLVVITVLILGLTGQLIAVAAGEMIRRMGEKLGAAGTASIFVPLMYALFETLGAVGGARADAVNQWLAFSSLAATATLAAWMASRRARGDKAAVKELGAESVLDDAASDIRRR